MSDAVEFWFDPGCPWTWITSRWFAEVTEARGVDVRWRTFSLKMKNEGQDVPEQLRQPMEDSLKALRVAEAVREAAGEEAVGRFYAEVGRRGFHGGVRPSSQADLEDVLAAVGLDAGLASAADDEGRDAAIRASMAEASDLVGDDVGVPILAFPAGDGSRGAFFGPVLSPAPTGEEALRLWDSVRAFATTPGFYELKRTRTGGPQMPDLA